MYLSTSDFNILRCIIILLYLSWSWNMVRRVAEDLHELLTNFKLMDRFIFLRIWCSLVLFCCLHKFRLLRGYPCVLQIHRPIYIGHELEYGKTAVPWVIQFLWLFYITYVSKCSPFDNYYILMCSVYWRG